MNRSITRGLAVSAVSALAVTGLSLVAGPAQAAEPDVTMISQFTGLASTRFDTSGSSTRLTARIDAANTQSVVFQLNPDPEAGDAAPGWRGLQQDQAAQIVGNYATVQWYGTDEAGRSFEGERVALRAVATNADGTSHSTVNDVDVLDGTTTDSVSIQTAAARYFLQPYADTDHASAMIPVTGTTTATEGAVQLSTWRNDTGEFVGQTGADVEAFQSKLSEREGYKTFGRFTGLVELTSYDIEEGVVAVAAERGADDVVPIPLTRQQITYVGASSDSNIRPGEEGDISIRVNDVDNVGILGAEVRRRSDDSLVGYTDADGFVFTTQVGESTEEYYANATDADPFDAADGDVSSGPVTASTYEPEATYTNAVLGDGTLFDADEYGAGDMVVLVTDQRQRPVGAGESVSYKIYPIDEAAPATYRTAVTNEDGIAVIDFAAAGASGDYLLSYVLTSQEDMSSDQTIGFTTGEAELLLSPRANPVVADAGGQIDYFGRLVLDGEPLPGRGIGLSYVRGYEVAPGNAPDASMLTPDGRRLEAMRTTNDNGSFRVTVDDRSETPQASEVDGLLKARTFTMSPTEDSSLDGNADATTTSLTRFGSGEPGTARITLGGTDNGADADRLKVTGPTSLAGESIKVFRVNARGKRFLVTTKTLNRTGDRPTIVVADGNGRARTTYVVRLLASERVQATDSNTKALR